MKKVAIHNLGCKVNSYEAESMEQMLISAGYEIVPFDTNLQADVYIINTCSVTNIADHKSRQMLHKAKKMNPDAVVVAAGCYVNANTESVMADESVDIVLGNNCKISIVDALNQYFNDSDNNRFLIEMNKEQEYENLTIDHVNEHTRAFIKIQDGCNQFCSYCIIPYTRGRIRSREMDDVYNEVVRLTENGYKEVVLTGIHLSSYGTDNGKGSLLDVIVNISKIEKLQRIRLGSLEPRIITEEFVSVISSIPKVCPHFHLSLQSGCDSTLKKMNRKYSTAEYYEKCELLRKYYDNPAITTDIIVGFPGETENDFEQTHSFVDKVGFFETHIFKYSRRKGTVADKMPDQINEEIKSVRSEQLINLNKQKSDAYRSSYIGMKKSVLIEEIVVPGKKQGGDGTDRYFSGYTDNYIRVYIPVEKLEKKEEEYINTLVDVKLEKSGFSEVLLGQLTV